MTSSWSTVRRTPPPTATANAFGRRRAGCIITDRAGNIRAVVGLVAQDVEGTLSTPTGDIPFRIAANEEQSLVEGRLESVRKPGLVPPRY